MTQEEKQTPKQAAPSTSAGKILAGSIYVLTAIFVLGFMWQAIASFI